MLQPVINEEMELRSFPRMLSLCASGLFLFRFVILPFVFPFSKTRRHGARKCTFWFSFVFLFECGRSETMHCYPNGRKDIMADVKKKKNVRIYSDSIVCSLYFQNKYIHVFFCSFFNTHTKLLCPLHISNLKIKCPLPCTHSLNFKLYVLITFETFPPTAW